jgi:plasmid stabilization system protein ParE
LSGLKKRSKNLEDEANYITLENPKAADDFSDAIFAIIDKTAQKSLPSITHFSPHNSLYGIEDGTTLILKSFQ